MCVNEKRVSTREGEKERQPKKDEITRESHMPARMFAVSNVFETAIYFHAVSSSNLH